LMQRTVATKPKPKLRPERSEPPKKRRAALRRFFNTCVKRKSPTCNPNIPKWIREAKNIQNQIIQKSDAIAFDVDDDNDDPEGLIQLMNRRATPDTDEHSACAMQVRKEATDSTGKRMTHITTKPAVSVVA